MGCVQRVTQQHDILERPICILDEHKVDPLGIIREQTVAIQVARKNISQISARIVIAHRLKAGIAPCLWIAFDNESAGVPVKFV